MIDSDWQIFLVPVDVSDDQIGYSRVFIAHDGVAVAEVLRHDEEVAYQIVKRLNEWEEEQRERWKRDRQLDEMGG